MRWRRDHGAITLAAPAKVNLSLDVLARRDDGFHEIDTLFAAISLFDRVTITHASRGEALVEVALAGSSDAPGLELVPCDGRNIVVKAGQALGERAGRDDLPPARVTIEKRIPVQAGLGGGSSDAAAALVGLNAFWGLGLTTAELSETGGRLGSDVSFFVHGRGRARGTGRGERIEPCDAGPGLELVLAKPRQGLSAGEVYASRGAVPSAHATAGVLRGATSGNRRDLVASLGNDLEAAAARRQNAVVRAACRLAEAGLRGVRMSGSGTTCFAISGTRRAAIRAARMCRRDPVVWSAAVTTLTRF